MFRRKSLLQSHRKYKAILFVSMFRFFLCWKRWHRQRMRLGLRSLRKYCHNGNVSSVLCGICHGSILRAVFSTLFVCILLSVSSIYIHILHSITHNEITANFILFDFINSDFYFLSSMLLVLCVGFFFFFIKLMLHTSFHPHIFNVGVWLKCSWYFLCHLIVFSACYNDKIQLSLCQSREGKQDEKKDNIYNRIFLRAHSLV